MVGVSPRISFSYEFIQSDSVPVEKQYPLRSNSSILNSSIDFDFCVRKSFEHQSSSADELFSDGKILPIQIKKNNHVPPKSLFLDQLAKPQPSLQIDGKKSLIKKESSKQSNTEGADQKQQSESKSFWRFKSSNSCVSGYGRSLCPKIPLLSRSLCPKIPLLSRSKSTSSAHSASTVKPAINKFPKNGNHEAVRKCFYFSSFFAK